MRSLSYYWAKRLELVPQTLVGRDQDVPTSEFGHFRESFSTDALRKWLSSQSDTLTVALGLEPTGLPVGCAHVALATLENIAVVPSLRQVFPARPETGRSPRLISIAGIIFMVCALVIACAGCGKNSQAVAKSAPPEVTFKPQEMADALHSVIAADREIYSRHILQRLQADEKLIKASENWQEEKALPVPAQILRMGSEAVQQKGAEFHYVLRSLWPINPRNAPETPIEKAGLQAVLAHPETNYYSQESLGGRRYFTAVYADKAIVSSCVDCHNAHPASSKRDFHTGEVMGGMIVRVPLEF